jgi:hypothetical protein
MWQSKSQAKNLHVWHVVPSNGQIKWTTQKSYGVHFALKRMDFAKSKVNHR